MRRSAVLLLTVSLVVGAASPALARSPWKIRIDRLVRDKSVAVCVRAEGQLVYSHAPKTKRIPASNQKLLMSMALFDSLDPSYRIATSAVAAPAVRGVIHGDLYVLGHGDPTLTGSGRYARSLPFESSRLGTLARRIKGAGVKRIEGDVVGGTGYFKRDWWATGWDSSFPAYEVARPTALSFEGNTARARHISHPERRLAEQLARRLRSLGVKVTGGARAALAPAADAAAQPIASTRSAPLRTLVRYMNRHSANFFAEVLGKRLGAERSGPRSSIATGARAISAWAAAQGVSIASRDSSGLSYRNRISPAGMVRLLEAAEREPWGDALRQGLPTGGEGTLEDRLEGVPIRAKTGTLLEVSALSGWLGLRKLGTRAEFSILSTGLSKWVAGNLENRIVGILHRKGR